MEGSTTISTITSAAGTALTSLQGDALSMISTVIPVAVVIMGATLVVMLGIKVFKKIANK